MRTLLLSTVCSLGLLAGAAHAEILAKDTPQPPKAHTFAAEMSSEDTSKMASLAKAYGTWGFDTTGMDTSVKPGDDFATYATGTAVKNMQIPGDQPGYGSFARLSDLSELREKQLIMDLAADPKASGEDLKIGDLYRSAMNSDLRNSLDARPLQPALLAISSLRTKEDMAGYMGSTAGKFGSAFFGLSVYDDAKNAGFYALQVNQGGLGLPDIDYYLSDKYADKKAAYLVYVTDMLTMAGYPDPAKNAQAIMDLETAIAKVSWTRIERRDDLKMYNPMPLSDLNTLAPGFDWTGFFKAAGVDGAKKVIVGEKTAFPKIAQIYADTPLDTLKAWEAFHTVDQASAYLSDKFYNRRFDFRSKTLYGVEEQRPLWKRAVGTVDSSLSDPVGRAYAARYFGPDAKAKMTVLVDNLLAAMKVRIENLTWMSAPTKAKALEKLTHFGVHIGYQDKWRDFSGLSVSPTDLYGNIERSSAFDWAWRVSQIDKPLDPNDWGMWPQTVNAEYSPTRNEIIFPAAILQPPFFDPKADMAVNYGGIGAVIGHEITHGFDDQGRHYDYKGNLSEWWTPEDATKFEAQTKALAAQYDQYQPVPGVNVKGDQTMGENIADLGGVLMAMDAYRLSVKGKPAVKLGGFTPEQRFYLGFAQVWESKYKDDFAKFLVAVDVHSPDHFRALGAPRNVDDWYTAFSVKPGDKYYIAPADRVRIW